MTIKYQAEVIRSALAEMEAAYEEVLATRREHERRADERLNDALSGEAEAVRRAEADMRALKAKQDAGLAALATRLDLILPANFDPYYAIGLDIGRLQHTERLWSQACDIARTHCPVDVGLSHIRDGIPMLAKRAEAAELGCEIAYRREPTQAEGDAHEYRHDQSMGASEAIRECHVPMGNHHGHRCSCGRWVWGGPTVCQRCVDAEAVKIALEWKAEADRLRLRADTDTNAHVAVKDLERQIRERSDELYRARHTIGAEYDQRIRALQHELSGAADSRDRELVSIAKRLEVALACEVAPAVGNIVGAIDKLEREWHAQRSDKDDARCAEHQHSAERDIAEATTKRLRDEVAHLRAELTDGEAALCKARSDAGLLRIQVCDLVAQRSLTEQWQRMADKNATKILDLAARLGCGTTDTAVLVDRLDELRAKAAQHDKVVELAQVLRAALHGQVKP